VASSTATQARLNFRLPSVLKRTIEQAAALSGQTVSDFAVSTLIRGARSVLEEHDRTRLTDRDRDRFIALLDASETRPNKALAAAARKYKKQVR
jgi:uncharacterized protein (DUF1778 family)